MGGKGRDGVRAPFWLRKAWVRLRLLGAVLVSPHVLVIYRNRFGANPLRFGFLGLDHELVDQAEYSAHTLRGRLHRAEERAELAAEREATSKSPDPEV